MLNGSPCCTMLILLLETLGVTGRDEAQWGGIPPTIFFLSKNTFPLATELKRVI